MDTRTGRIYTEKELIEKFGSMEDAFKQMPWLRPIKAEHITPKQRFHQKIGRNDPCPCGSEKKFKKCCYMKREK